MAESPFDPCVSDNFSRALEEELDFTGGISYHRSYTDPPNPGLSLSELGSIGLPLNPREAQVIRTRAGKTPVQKGERVIEVGTSVEAGIWQLDGSSVTLENPSWNDWLQGVLCEVCEVLGVSYAASAPRCDLDKLLLYETGSHILPHVGTQISDGMFATMTIVLPSRFSGGAAHFSYGAISKVYDCSKHSNIQTSVLAWYTDVVYEVKPITSGYCLALVYNLIHTTTAPRPALSSNETVVKMLRDAFLAWKASTHPGSPQKILYLLKHQYSQASLHRSVLKGTDAQHVELIEPLAKELGFRLGLATVECHLLGYTDDRHSCSCDCHDDEDLDPDDAEFEEIEDERMEISKLVNLEGTELTAKLGIGESTETIPDELDAAVKRGEHYEQECERHGRYYTSSTLTRSYRGHVLVIWPKYADYLVTGDLDGACNDLYSIVSQASTQDERMQVELLIPQITRIKDLDGVVRIADAVCTVACRWKDAEMWLGIVNVCTKKQGLRILNAESLRTAIVTFGFDTIKPGVENVIQNEWRNKPLFNFFDEFCASDSEESKENIHDVNIEESVLPWIEEQYTASLKAIRKPEVDDFATFLQLTLKNGGLPFLCHNILPQIVPQADAAFLKDFATCINREPAFAADPNVPLKHEIVVSTMKAAISKLGFTLSHPSYVYPDKLHPAVALAKSYLKACIDLECPHLSSMVLEKIGDTSALLPPVDAKQHAEVLILPFLAFAAEYVGGYPELAIVPGLSGLAKAAAIPILDNMIANPQDITRIGIASFLEIFALAGGAKLFAATVVPKLQTLASTDGSASALLEELHTRRQLLSPDTTYDGPSMQEVIDIVAKQYAGLTNTTTYEKVISAIDLCIRVQALDAVGTLLQHVLDAKKLKQRVTLATGAPLDCNATFKTAGASYISDETYADQVLLPLIPALRQLAVKYNLLDVLAPAFRMIMRVWTQDVLGPLPSDPVARIAAIRCWTCSCTECSAIQVWLLTKPHRSIVLERIGAPKRKHIESFLVEHVTREAATWETISTSPHGLKVTKTDLLHDPGLWKANQAKAVKMIHAVSSDAKERKRIFGDDLVEFTKWMKGLSATAAASVASTRSVAAPTVATTSGTTFVPLGVSTQQGAPDASTVLEAKPSAVKRMSRSSDQATPSKRRKIERSTSVVDLTSA